MKKLGEILIRIPAPIAGFMGGAFAWGVLVKNGVGLSVATGALMSLGAGVAAYAVWRYSMSLMREEWKAVWSAAWLMLWPLGLMAMWEKLEVPHLGAWLLGVSGGGFLWMSFWLPSLTKNYEIRLKSLRWAVPTGFIGALLWEAASGRYDYTEFLVMGQVGALALVMVAPLTAKLSVAAGSVLCVILAGALFVSSWAAHAPHCGNARKDELFECVVNGYDIIKDGAPGWRFEGDGSLRVVGVNGVKRRAVVARAPAELNFTFDEVESPVSFYVSMLREAWERPGDGVRFEVFVQSGGQWRKAGEKYINPKQGWRDRAWIKMSFDVRGEDVEKWRIKLYPGPRIRPPFSRKADSCVDWAAVSPEVASDGRHGS